jgi:hypothetical protein
MQRIRLKYNVYVLECNVYVLECNIYVLECNVYVLECNMNRALHLLASRYSPLCTI